MRQPLQGIAGLEGSAPVGAVLTVGKKKPSGAIDPASTDRYWIKLPQPADKNIRPLHPLFGAFNSHENTRLRQTVTGHLIHGSLEEVAAWKLAAYDLSHKLGQNPVSRRPHCEGDGVQAVRYAGVDGDGKEIFNAIECPNELCPFRMGPQKACKPSASLYFRLSWPKATMPEIFTRFTTGSWYTAANLKGFVEYVEDQARNLGISPAPVYGLPIRLTLTRKTIPGKSRSFPVTHFEPDCDLVQFFLAYRRNLEAAGGHLQLAPAASAGDPDELTERDADHFDMEPGALDAPAAVADVVDAEEVPEPSPPPAGADVLALVEEFGGGLPAMQKLVAEYSNDLAKVRAFLESVREAEGEV